jgi:hypothetical protein
MDYNILIAQIIDKIEVLQGEQDFVTALAGEDESFLDVTKDFFCRLEDQFTYVEAKEDDPVAWRLEQDAETD